MKSFISLITIILFSHTVFAQSKRVITHEDLVTMKRVGPPAVSPDGKWVIFSVNELAYNDKDQSNDLWIAAVDQTSAPRKLTSSKAGETGYSWSPDGQYISFSAKRDSDEEPQIYLLNMKTGGEAQKFSKLSSGATSAKWRNDSKALLFTSKIYPGAYVDSLHAAKAKQKKDQKYKARVYETFPIQNFDVWLDEQKPSLYVQHLDSNKAINIFKNVKIAGQLGFEMESAIWVGENEIVFSATTEANTEAYQYSKNQLYKLNILSGDAVKITNPPLSYYSPKISENGKYLYCNTVNFDYKVYFLSKLTRFDWPNMQNAIELNTDLDRPINGYIIDNNTAIASVEDQGRDKIFKLSGGKNASQISTGSKGCYSSIAGTSNNLVAAYETSKMPTEIVKINADGNHTFITSFNKKRLNELDLPDIETFWTKTSLGKNIRSILQKPANFDPNKKYPLLVMMHGGPAGAYKENWTYNWNAPVLAADNMVIVMTDYTGSTGYGEKFSQDIQYDPFKGPANEINEAASDAIKRFSFIDGNSQVCSGASYGGHLANWMQATTKHYKCLISHAGLVNSISQWGTSDGIYGREVMNGGTPWSSAKTWKEQNPITFADQFKTPMLITVGERDFRVPMNNSIENFHILQRLKIPSKLVIFPEENHWILKPENSKFMYQTVKEWLMKYLN